MGGCRCYFRDCHTNNPKYSRLHFFRFPLKDVERYRKWRQFAKTEQMLEYTEIRRKNMNICARHFRAECFMNYKMDRLALSAVPTLIRLTKDQALDFEVDMENGVLVTLDRPKLKHLIPPDNFEDVLHLEDDNILIEKLNELQRSPLSGRDIAGDMEFGASDPAIEYEEVILQKPVRNLVNTVEILETIQVKAPNLKRNREMTDEVPGGSENNKKCKILNANNCTEGRLVTNQTTIVLDSCEMANGDIIDFVEAEDIPNHQELVNEADDDEAHFLLTTDDFNLEAEDAEMDEQEQEQQLVEIHNDNHFQYDLMSCEDDPDTTIVELKRNRQNSETEDLRRQLESTQIELSELQKKLEDCNILQAKLADQEVENAKLQESCQENEALKGKLHSLQKENNNLKKSSNENKTLKEKLQECREENKKLKEECTKIDILKAEIISRQQETKELKKLLESLKTSQNKEQKIVKKIEEQLETERANSLNKEKKLKEEISKMKTKLENTQQQLVYKENELKDVKIELNSKKMDNESLRQRLEQLEQSLNNIQNNFDVKQNDYVTLKTDYDNVQQKYTVLEQKYWKLQALQNQEATVSTSLENSSRKAPTPTVPPTAAISANSLTKAQLFNGIKRYLSSAMVSLLRMEMFGSSEREWKTDERQVAVDILRLGETVYKYFTDEWRFRLPGLRDARNWLSQSQNLMDDEEDL